MVYWESYRYTDPVAEKLTAEFGAPFELQNTGGGCICLHADLEGGMYILVGCAVDGPLLHDDERSQFAYQGGYGVGLYGAEGGGTLSHAIDYRATTPDDVVALVQRVLDMAPRDNRNPDKYVSWTRHDDGTISTKEYLN